VWLGGAENAAQEAAEALRLPVIANGQARGVLPGGRGAGLVRGVVQRHRVPDRADLPAAAVVDRSGA
jgi:hypothetical protein